MKQNLIENANSFFESEYTYVLRNLRLELEALIYKYHQNQLNMPPLQFTNRINQILIKTARNLSQKRLELDVASLKKFNYKVNDNILWLENNQEKLLLDSFWDVVLDIYQDKRLGMSAFGAQSQMYVELTHILNDQVKYDIKALSLEPELQPETQQIINANQVNIARDNSVIKATLTINNHVQIEDVATKLINLIKASSNIPDNLKNETIELVETTTDNIKAGKHRKTIIESLGEKLKLLTTADSAIKASNDLAIYANKLWELLKPFIS